MGMILQNKGMKDLLFVDESSGKSIFHNICKLGHLKLLLFLESMMDKKEFIDDIFACSNEDDEKPIEFAIRYSHPMIVKHLFDKKQVQDRYKNNDPMLFRLCINLFVYNSNPHIIDYVLSALQISKEKVVQMLSYKCPQQGRDRMYHQKYILTAFLWTGTFDHLQRFIDFIGEQAFIDHMFNVDKLGRDVMRWSVQRNNVKVIEYILSIDQIQKKYLSDNNSLHYLCGSLNEWIANKQAVKYVVDTLGITEAKLSELNEFRAINIKKILPFTK